MRKKILPIFFLIFFLSRIDLYAQDPFPLLKSRKDAQALEILEKILKEEPDNLEALWGKAEVLRRRRDFAAAESILQRILEKNPHHASSLITLSYIRYKDNQLKEAIKLVREVLKQQALDKENQALAYMMLGSINSRYSKEGGFLAKIRYGTRIKAYFLKARGLAPDLPEVHLGLGTFYLLAPAIAGGNVNKAIEELTLALSIAPDFATPHARLAQAYKEKSDLEKYKIYLKQAEELDPENEVLGEIESCQDRELYKDTRILMGTFVEVTSPDKRASGIVFAEIKRLDDLLSKYKPESEISQLNKALSLRAGPDTVYILKRSREFWEASDGAFDITVGPLLDLWGFTDKKYILPEEGKIKSTLKLIGMDKIIFNQADNVIKLGLVGVKVDLGGIAKGYAVDCAVNKLKSAGITSCLINAGGQVYALGSKFREPWRIAVKNPRGKGFIDYLELRDKAVATSGDYEQYFILGNKRYSHILNPKTGYPADSGVISATVIASDGLTSDALATAIVVLGRVKGEALAGRFPGVEVKIIEEKDING